MQLCSIICKRNKEIISCYHSISICDDACNMERVSSLGNEAKNPSFV